ncbi:MAG: RHS repeat protein [Chitinophagaceae bacterium]|nr:RHS repeat protein [Chitinophagaceae bacterium]
MAYFIHRYSKFSGRYVKIILISLLVLSAVKAGAQNINKPNKQGPMGTEVNTYSGNLFISRNDIYIPARGFDINITFHYNSFNFDVDAGYGKGWSFNYAIRYKNDTASGKKIIWGDGRVDRYTSLGGGGFKSPKGYFTTFTQYQPDKYLLTQSDGAKLYFDNNVHQRITKLEEPNGNQVVFNYTDTLLTSLVNAAGQTISFTYNTNGRLASVIDAVAAPTRTFLYTYDFSGYLTQVADPLGYTNKYAYLVNGPMKSMTDKNNNVIDIIYFNDFTISEIIGCNKRVSFSYDTATHTSLATDHLSTGSNQVTKYSFKNLKTRSG